MICCLQQNHILEYNKEKIRLGQNSQSLELELASDKSFENIKQYNCNIGFEAQRQENGVIYLQSPLNWTDELLEDQAWFWEHPLFSGRVE